ncbi:TPD1 protein-like protein 1A [Dichanthelium oligosanthes]|uniref:TPD1 protein-like protein 1A n=1 Tax=Dichanthelium oligosanthes TaxID=888268 RepID=A0A1E5WHA2_9POAL|nr:TPD1 protein-like protein 1A [Dichanthelium oligosanthes]
MRASPSSSSSTTASPTTRAFAASAWLIVLLGSAGLASASDHAGFSPPPTAVPAGPPRPAPRAVGVATALPAPVPLPLPRKILRPPGVDGAAGGNATGGSGVGGGAAAGGGPVRPSRMDEGCAGAEDIEIYQGHASPLPSGVPAYKVDVVNRCLGDLDGGSGECAIAGIHVRCGWFSSVSLVDPSKFRRLGHDDCLLNDGRPMLGGETISFEYSNSFKYELSVRVATCVDPTASP